MCVWIALQWVAFVTNKEIFLHRIHPLNENIKQTLYKTDIQLILKKWNVWVFVGDDFSLNFKQFFHWPFVNEKQSMFTFALVFLQAIDILLLIFNLFLLFAERGRRNLEEIIHNENHWPQLLHKSGVECQIDRFACFAAYSLFIFSERKCISKSWRKSYEL